MKKLSLIIISLSFFGQLNAQTPHKDLGIKESEIEYLTLSDGRYDEYHGYKDFERVGSAIIDMRTRKIVRFISRDSILDEGMFELDMTTRFLTIDPLAEMYSEMSPYGYCANNPIKFIDPNGMYIDNYGVDDNGNVTKLEETKDNYDVLYKVKKDDKGNLVKQDTDNKAGITESDGQKVNDRTVLPELSKTETVDGRGVSKASTGSKGADDIINVFKFAAKNTSVEWRLDRFGNNGGDNFMVSTMHRKDFSPSSFRLGLSESSIRANMHSHPGISNDIAGERYSMGDDGITRGTFMGGTDYAIAINNYYSNNNKEPYPAYNYFPISGRKYHVSPFGIKNVNSTIRTLIKGN